MNRLVSLALVKALLSLAIIVYCSGSAWSEPMPGSLPAQWNIGAENCAASSQAPLQVHAYELQTFILRQNPCANPEANFLYLLIGSQKALLIDTGAVAESNKMPLALASFNGFYASHENYSITHPMHNLLAVLCAAFVLLSVLGFASYRLLLRWRHGRRQLASS
jgi:hypothetical protein